MVRKTMRGIISQMLVHFRTQPRSSAGKRTLRSTINLLINKRPKLSQVLTLKMLAQPISKRPICLSCSKPAIICLCNRIKIPHLENSVAVMILQHSLERKHPLNSTRIAKLGLKNLSVVSVSDVNFEAQFMIRFLDTDSRKGPDGNELKTELKEAQAKVDQSSSLCSNVRSNTQLELFSGYPQEKTSSFTAYNGSSSYDNCITSNSSNTETEHFPDPQEKNFCVRNNPCRVTSTDKDERVIISATVSKYGFNHLQKGEFDEEVLSLASSNAMANGFVVKKLQRKKLANKIEEHEEFEITVPRGSVLLFPSEQSVGVEGIDFKVKNLIVLDGTWAKAKRMYSENPWLKLLPHLKLDLEKMSLYGDVRHQPKTGLLSTIESIVYALKAVGDNPEGLNELLNVFESMVGDQRRCKDERLSKVS